MKPEGKSQTLLSITSSKAKMYEYGVPLEYHIDIPPDLDPADLLTLTIGLLGDLTSQINSETPNANFIDELSKNVNFSARFFDAYLQSRLRQDIDPYLLLLASASYYLCGLPGSSELLISHIKEDQLDLGCLGLGKLLYWILQRNQTNYTNGANPLFAGDINGITHSLTAFLRTGNESAKIFEFTKKLRQKAYDIGTPRQLLFADIICAVAKKRFENSTWYCLPRFSYISQERWAPTIQKETFIKELWPAQRLLGEKGIFKGKSAVVQMPTSAGKTRATEIIIRSIFLTEQTSLAIIVAPFRALCHEIKNSLVEDFRGEPVNIDELTDVLQSDFDIQELLGAKQILVVTPEKLIYVLRKNPEIALHIGLLIYDEGHQFDSGERGITYELLITSLKSMVPENIQTILISAVISNAEAIGSWLNGADSEIVSGTNLNPTFRTIAFTSWLDRLGQLKFVNLENPDNDDFFVPRIIEQQTLNLKPRDKNERKFPNKNDGGEIALYLGLKVIKNGSVAVFCGRKDSAVSLCDKIVDAYDRGLALAKPADYSNSEEIRRISYQYELNLGKDCAATKCAKMGIFTHHGNTPQGIRLAVEHALKNDAVKFVICTSTLAQGVNLPIRYLIVTSVYQGAEPIRVRDFHNLIGRAGRAGMHTEGSIIFADPRIYDKRNGYYDKWRWQLVKKLLKPENSEPCASTLLSFFDPIMNDDRDFTTDFDGRSFINRYYENREGNLDSFVNELLTDNQNMGFSKEGIESQLSWKMNIISSVENYLMANWDIKGTGLEDEDITALAKGTLAYFLSEVDQQNQITDLFGIIATNIRQKVTDPVKRKIYGKTLYGVQVSLEIDAWVNDNLHQLVDCNGIAELFMTVWPLINKNIQNNIFRKCDNQEKLKEISLEWINGSSFLNIFKILTTADVRVIARTQTRKLKIENVVDLCEGGLAYDGTLVINAISEIVDLVRPEGYADLILRLQELQKRLKYGLPDLLSITLYELGFADRPLCIGISGILTDTAVDRRSVKRAIKQNERQIKDLLQNYPSYFIEILNNLG
jgi:POLQ-like helicase